MTQFAFEIPTIKAGDVSLRAIQENDLEPLAAFYATERSMFVGGPLPRVDAWRMISGNIGHWALRGYGMWVIDMDRQPVGMCGFIFREGWDEPELGWQVWNGFEARGIAFQSASAARDQGVRAYGLNGVISYIDPRNSRSIKLAERLGALFERETVFMGKPCHVYRHPQQEECA
ncbi:GNAT family N-acetyltransferase [Seohaeicola saemankumensis]|uniref:GNAT family N-acetyltransferase n=1 Tax=Seohaeicola saemankumensis TaxID=481181 RepID=UPI001E5A2226|nr:GNAT family N-acetyltransferase [Seohaeicola saemankumensis]MCD1627525.1 GNAT family N-acetyltransferase [Seohaeicola saemankumensis]